MARVTRMAGGAVGLPEAHERWRGQGQPPRATLQLAHLRVVAGRLPAVRGRFRAILLGLGGWIFGGASGDGELAAGVARPTLSTKQNENEKTKLLSRSRQISGFHIMYADTLPWGAWPVDSNAQPIQFASCSPARGKPSQMQGFYPMGQWANVPMHGIFRLIISLPMTSKAEEAAR